MLRIYLFCVFLTLVLSQISYYLVSTFLFILVTQLVFVFPLASWGSSSLYRSIDGLRYLLIILTILVSILGLLRSFKLIEECSSKTIFVVLVIFLIVLLIMSFGSRNFIMFYIFFEASLVPLMILVVGYGNQPEKVGAGLYMLFYTIFGSLPLLVGLIIIFEQFGSLYLNYIYFVNLDLRLVYFPLIFFAFFVRLPGFLVHLWLPKAHVEAPVFGSMILAGVMLKLGGYGIIRFIFFFKSELMPFSDLILSFSLVGGVLIGLVCLMQRDMKSLVAYSSVGHIMIFLGGIFSFRFYGNFGGVVIIIAHGLTSAGMFSLINIVYERVHSRRIFIVRGLLLVSPFLRMFWFILSIRNMAAPPFLNLVGELMLSFSLVGVDMFYGLPLGFMFFIRGAYSIYFFSLTQHGTFYGGGLFNVNLNMRESFIIFMHILPLFLLVLKLDLIS